MTTLIKSHFEKLLLILAGTALLCSGGWCWWRKVSGTAASSVVNAAREDYRPIAPAALSAPEPWPSPVAQSAGAAWVFEVFAPPLIQRDADTGEFVAGPRQLRRENSRELGIELLAIREIPYRVQLQGGFERADGYIAALAAAETRDVWCGRPGERWAAMQIVLEKMEVGTDAFAGTDPGTGAVHLAQATLRDEKTGRQVVLVAGVPTMTRDLRAVVRLAGSTKTQNLEEGEICDDGETTYRVERLTLDPVAVAVVTKMESDDEAGETLLLRPEKSGAVDPGKAARAESSSPPHSFHNGP